jgi:hypothetical protein
MHFARPSSTSLGMGFSREFYPEANPSMASGFFNPTNFQL